MRHAYTTSGALLRIVLPGRVLALLVATSHVALGQTSRPDFVAYPMGPVAGQWALGAGLGIDVLPRRLVESEWRQVPRLMLRGRQGLGRNFYLSQRADVIVIDNQLQGGLGWGQRLGALTVGLVDHWGVTWGTIGVEGFDSTFWAFAHNPALSVAGPVRGVFSTLTLEGLILHARHVKVGEASLTEKRMSFEGLALSTSFESPLASGDVIFYGFSVIYAKPDYQLWLAFSDAEQRQLYPRFFGGYAF